MTALTATQNAIPDDIQVITVADREADFYPLFAAERRTGAELLIRAAHNRRVDADTQLLEEAIAAAPVGGTLTIAVPRRDEKPARQATLALRWTSVTFGPPQNAKQRATLPHIPVQVVVAEELSPPAGDRLQRALAVYCVVAWRLLWLTYEARQQPDEVCTVVLAAHEWQALYCTIHQTAIPPATPPTLRQAVRWIAQLGGFLARTGDGEPGVQTIWRGLRRLDDIAAIWLLLHHTTPNQLDNSSYG